MFRITSRSIGVAVLMAVAPVVLIAACSGSDDTSDPDASSDAAGSTVTVDHRFGSTTLEGTPERIVSLDNQWTDVLTALDGPLVGAALDPVIEGGRYPWQDLPESVEDIPITDSIPYEAVAALRPDLIVITWGAKQQGDYDRLSQIAPTIPLLGDEEVDAWQDITTVAGTVLDDEDGAQQLIDDTEAQATQLAADLPGLEGTTFALANYVPGDGIYVVADPDDGSVALFQQLGMEIDPDLVAIADGASGRAELSLERVDELDADALFLLTNGADPAEIPGYDLLPAVQNGAVAILDVASATALNTPTPLSLPWVIDEIRPTLEAAASPAG